MVDSNNRIDSLANFKRHTAEYLERLKTTGKPMVLTINGKAQVVVQDLAAYQRLVDVATRAERNETMAAIRAGLADAETGRVKPAKVALKALAYKYGLDGIE